MPTTPILQKDQASLREKSVPVDPKEIGSKSLMRIIDSMKKALEEQPDGVAIAAPQIGENIRLFVVSRRAFAIEREMQGIEPVENENDKDLVCINPEIIRMSRKKESMDEGCLSVRWLYGKVERSIKTRIRALDERGKSFEHGGSGIMSEIFQHEVDHLNGILFIDKATDVREMHPDEIGLNDSQ
jgi:peptide deformylase